MAKFPVDRLIKEDNEAAQRFAKVGGDSGVLNSARQIDYLLASNLGNDNLGNINRGLGRKHRPIKTISHQLWQ